MDGTTRDGEMDSDAWCQIFRSHWTLGRRHPSVLGIILPPRHSSFVLQFWNPLAPQKSSLLCRLLYFFDFCGRWPFRLNIRKEER